jgi:hypothetical protein
MIAGEMKHASRWEPEAAAYPLAAVALVGVFLSFIYNRFLPVQDAWFAHYGALIRDGRLPYRDFYCFIQPLPLVLARAIVAVGGDHLIAFRLYAVAERLALTAVLYDMLRQCFSRYAAFAGAVVSVVMMTTSADDALFGYFITCILFGAAALGALARGFRAPRGAGYVWCGVFLALAFFTKQSSGGLLGVALFGVILWASGDFRAIWRALMKVGAGFATVGLVVAAVLFALGLMGDYLRDVFFNAIGQKGGAGAILTGFWFRLNLWPYVLAVVAACAALFTCWVAGWLRPWPASARQRPVFLVTGALGLLALMLPVLLNATVVPWFIATRVYVALLFVIPLTFYATLILLLHLLLNRRKLLEARAGCNPGLLALAAGGMAGLLASGMSYEITAGALAPALGVCLAYGLDFLAGLRAIRFALVALTIFLLFTGATKKYLSSYWWWGWEDTTLHPRGVSRLPQLAGFDLDPAEIATYENIVNLITRRASGADTVFSFPNCPLFNVLTGRLQPTFAPVHFLDVCPDAVERRDAAYLRDHPPRILIWLRAPAADEARLERSFRGGAPNGYQEMESTLRDLTESPAYSLGYRTQYNDESFPLEVWVRR